MKKWMKKTGLLAASVVALTSVISAVPASAEASRVVYFTVQDNSGCDATYREYFSLNVNNISATDANVTVRLYSADGEEVFPTTVDGNGYHGSTITPGTSTTIPAKKTNRIYAYYGFNAPAANTCSRVPAYGKIIIDGDAGLLMANGEIKGAKVTSTSWTFEGDTPVIVNGGMPF